jgi:hypothetical protein
MERRQTRCVDRDASLVAFGSRTLGRSENHGVYQRDLQTGADSRHPREFAEGLDPVISPTYNTGVPKGSRHPNVGHLFAVFLTYLEAQEMWEKFNGQISALIPGTTAYKYAQGKNLLQMHQNKAQTVDRLARLYGKILGFER